MPRFRLADWIVPPVIVPLFLLLLYFSQLRFQFPHLAVYLMKAGVRYCFGIIPFALPSVAVLFWGAFSIIPFALPSAAVLFCLFCFFLFIICHHNLLARYARRRLFSTCHFCLRFFRQVRSS